MLCTLSSPAPPSATACTTLPSVSSRATKTSRLPAEASVVPSSVIASVNAPLTTTSPSASVATSVPHGFVQTTAPSAPTLRVPPASVVIYASLLASTATLEALVEGSVSNGADHNSGAFCPGSGVGQSAPGDSFAALEGLDASPLSTANVLIGELSVPTSVVAPHEGAERT